MDLNKYFNELDSCFEHNDIKKAEELSLEWLKNAAALQDKAAVLAISNELGGIYRVTSRFRDAENAYNIALTAIGQLNLTDTEKHATTLLNMASVYSASGNMEKALSLYEQSAAIYKKSGSCEDYNLAALYNNISHVYEDMGDLSKAEDYANKSIEIIKHVPGYPIEMATSYTSLSSIYIKQGKYDEAEQSLITAERIFLDAGPENPHYAAALNNFGELYYKVNDFKKSAEYFEKSLALIGKVYGENSAYGLVCGNLAKVYSDMGNFHTAEKYRAKSEEIKERTVRI
ncbi:MAG: tetratricopeptide repeat protein [Anaerovoracaceae bacterium]